MSRNGWETARYYFEKAKESGMKAAKIKELEDAIAVMIPIVAENAVNCVGPFHCYGCKDMNADILYENSRILKEFQTELATLTR